MMLHHSLATRVSVAISGATIAVLLACGTEEVGTSRAPLVAQCLEPGTPLTPGAWLCPADATLECNFATASNDVIFASPPAGKTCNDVALSVAPGPYPPGTYQITVEDTSIAVGDRSVCTAQLTVVDTLAPVLTPKQVELWPPNHKLVALNPRDCMEASDACDPDLDVVFTKVWSSESFDDKGDGDTEADIVVSDCRSVQVRAERSGLGEGRTYHLEIRATDHSGHVTDGACDVIVPHDQGKSAVVGAPLHAVEVPACPKAP